MLKKVFGNSEYYISENGVLHNKAGQACTLGLGKNDKIKISIYGHRCYVTLNWLRNVSMFKMQLPEEYRSDYSNIEFIDIIPNKLGFKADVMMFFKKPYTILEKYRIVPNYPNMAVSCDGEIIETYTGLVINKHIPAKAKYYPSARAEDPFTGEVRSHLVHRLVALAWVPNNDPSRWMVNHKDGNKHNFYYKNLEWVTPGENNDHAFANGLRSDNTTCIVQDTKTWEVHSFPTMSEACRWMDIPPRVMVNFDNQRVSKILKDRYEIRFGDDRTPWVYSKGDVIRAGRYTITVDLGQGDIRTYHDRRDMQSDLKIWNVSNIEEACKKGQQQYPLAKFDFVDSYTSETIQYINTKTREIKEGNTIAEIARVLNLHKSNVRNALAVGEARSFQGYAFRYKTDTEWCLEIQDAPSKSVCIQARHKTTNEVLMFDSLRKVAEHFNKDRSVINARLNTDKDFEGWLFKEM